MIQIQVKNVFEGTHWYADAPEEVSFLRSPHRHQFVVRTTIEVFDQDRELEFIIVQRKIREFVLTLLGFRGTIDLGGHSCEWLAEKVLQYIQNTYGSNRSVIVSVFEDDENGAIVSKGVN